MKIIFPFILPFVGAVVGNAGAAELNGLSVKASVFRVPVFVINAKERQINKRKYADLAWLNWIFRISTYPSVRT